MNYRSTGIRYIGISYPHLFLECSQAHLGAAASSDSPPNGNERLGKANLVGATSTDFATVFLAAVLIESLWNAR